MSKTPEFGNAIRRLRGDRSQAEIAKRAGIDPSLWSSYEKGRHYPRTRERFEQIAKGLGCTYDRLREVESEERRKLVEQQNPSSLSATDVQPSEAGAVDQSRGSLRSFIQETTARMHQDLEKMLLRIAEQKSPES